jgi:hypothetical protein
VLPHETFEGLVVSTASQRDEPCVLGISERLGLVRMIYRCQGGNLGWHLVGTLEATWSLDNFLSQLCVQALPHVKPAAERRGVERKSR